MEDVANQVNSLQVMDNNDDENHRRQEEEIVVVDQEARPATTTSDAGAAATGEAISMKRAVEVFCHFVITGCTVKDALLDIEGFMGKDKYEICDPIMFVVSRVHLEMLESFADEQDPDPAVQEEDRRFLLAFQDNLERFLLETIRPLDHTEMQKIQQEYGERQLEILFAWQKLLLEQRQELELARQQLYIERERHHLELQALHAERHRLRLDRQQLLLEAQRLGRAHIRLGGVGVDCICMMHQLSTLMWNRLC